MKQYTLIDQWIIKTDRVLRAIAGVATAGARRHPAAGIAEGDLNAQEKKTAARLMRVNHAGEIAAQGLYHGQALLARNQTTRDYMLGSAHEEAEHLYWCQQRIKQLGGRTSLLAPLWYGGSFAIGALASSAGDQWSLAFIKETEDQVVAHLQSHLSRLSPKDRITRAIILQVIADEQEHAAAAQQQSQHQLPNWASALMRTTAKVMTISAYRL